MFDLEEYVFANCNVLRRAPGGELVLRECPNCYDTTGRMYVNVDKQAYNCYKCEFSGRNPAGFIAKLEGISYVEARRMMFEAIDFVRPSRDKVHLFRDHTGTESPGLPDEYKPCYNRSSGKWNGVPSYLKGRNVSRKAIMVYKLGWCEFGRFKDRIIFPIITLNLISFQARATWDVGPDGVKYDSPKLAPHRKMLHGYHCAKPEQELWVVEGPMDVIGCYQAGLNAVGLIGKEMSDAKANLIIKLKPTAVHIMLDPEAEKNAQAVARALAHHVKVDMVHLPSGDPGDIEPDTLKEWARDFKPYKRRVII